MFSRTKSKFTTSEVNALADDVFNALTDLIEVIHYQNDLIRERINSGDWSVIGKLFNSRAESVKCKLYKGYYSSKVFRRGVRIWRIQLAAETIAEDTGTDYEEVYEFLLDLMIDQL